jgi:predicted transcriptional regulator of viral defense system
MKTSDLYQIHHFGLIQTADLKAYALSHSQQWSSVLVNLTRWQKEGLLERVTRGAYLVRDIPTDPAVVACALIPEAYISLEYAMSHHGMLLDRVYRVDLACARRVRSFDIRNTHVHIAKIPPRLNWGWETADSIHGPIRIARPEKALFDRIYLDRRALPGTNYFEDMGLQPDSLDPNTFAELAKISPKVKRFSSALKDYCHE